MRKAMLDAGATVAVLMVILGLLLLMAFSLLWSGIDHDNALLPRVIEWAGNVLAALLTALGVSKVVSKASKNNTPDDKQP